MEWLQEGDSLGWREFRSWKVSCYLPGTSLVPGWEVVVCAGDDITAISKKKRNFV